MKTTAPERIRRRAKQQRELIKRKNEAICFRQQLLAEIELAALEAKIVERWGGE